MGVGPKKPTDSWDEVTGWGFRGAVERVCP